MANVKIFMDHALVVQKDAVIDGLLAEVRSLVSTRLQVAESACQLAVVAVRGLPDQPAVNVEIHLLPKADRTTEKLRSVCEAIRDLVATATAARTAIRCALLDGETYIALK